MLVACRLAVLSALVAHYEPSIGARNSGRKQPNGRFLPALHELFSALDRRNIWPAQLG